MTKMKRITAAILCALFSIISLSAALIFADTDPTSKFSDKLKEAYEKDEEVYVYIHYQDTVDHDAIEAEVLAQMEIIRAELIAQGLTGAALEQTCRDEQYNIESELTYNAYYQLGLEMFERWNIEYVNDGYTRISQLNPFISRYTTYEEALMLAQDELVISLTVTRILYDDTSETEPETENAYDDDTESGDITEDVGTEDWDDGTVPDETDPEPTTDSTEPTDPTEPPTDAPDLLVGDVDEDGLITATDASNILILAAEMGLGYEPTFEELYAADYNADGNADATDASLILIFAAEEGVK